MCVRLLRNCRFYYLCLYDFSAVLHLKVAACGREWERDREIGVEREKRQWQLAKAGGRGCGHNMRRASSASFLIIMWKISFYKFKTFEMCDFFCCVCVSLCVCVWVSVYAWLYKYVYLLLWYPRVLLPGQLRARRHVHSERTELLCYSCSLLSAPHLQLFCSLSSAPYLSLAIEISGASFRYYFLHAALQSICQLIAGSCIFSDSSKFAFQFFDLSGFECAADICVYVCTYVIHILLYYVCMYVCKNVSQILYKKVSPLRWIMSTEV